MIDGVIVHAAFRKGTLLPRVVPFQISLTQAQMAFEEWQRSHWLSPSKLLHKGLVSMRAALLPFWLFEATVHVEYTGGNQHCTLQPLKYILCKCILYMLCST